MYNSAVFYYMSGTGNTFKAAQWSGEELKAQGCGRVALVPFEKVHNIEKPAENTLTAIYAPTHGFTAAWPAISFALRMPRASGSHAIVGATRAGAFYPFPLPGMEGTACLIIALILYLKGYDVRGFRAFDMPSNWLVVHWGMNKKHSEYFYDKTKREVPDFIHAIVSERRQYKSWPSWLMGLALIQVSFIYVAFARLFLSKIMFADETCNSCGICEKYCPHNGIKMTGRKNKRPYWTFQCESCERCIGYCPQHSIQGGHSYMAIIFWLMYGVLGYFPVYILSTYGFFKNHLASMLFSMSYTLLFFFLGQIALHWLTKIKFVAKLFSHTTLTKIYRRYHQHDTGLNELRDGKEM